MLQIQTFDARAGGNVLYKALAHPLAAEGFARLYAKLAGPVALYDPDGIADAVVGMYPGLPGLAGVYVHDVLMVGKPRAGHNAQPLTDVASSGARTVLIAAFDAARIAARIAHLLPPGATVLTLDEARLPDAMLTNRSRYLDKLNFATNFVFFRDQDGLSTRLVTANYWANYGAASVRAWLRLFDADGAVLATWEEALPPGAGGIEIDSRAVRARFKLPAFTGQICLHAIGATGHDVVKYALDTFATDNGASLSCTHDANAWPSDRYAGLPAPRDAVPIPPGTLQLDRMGAETPAAYQQEIGPFATVGLDVADLLPGLHWPAQIELRAGRHMVRPRYEVTRADRTRIAHVNVERADLRPDPTIAGLPAELGRGFLLPFPVLDLARFRTIVQPTPMAETQATLPLRLDVFASDGSKLAERFLGNLPRSHDLALDFDAIPEARLGHAELVYDFRDGGAADGWMHTLVRYEDRQSGHVFNTAMTYRDEPQSYNGPPPGLSTRLFLKLGDARRRSFSHLIYPSSAPWRPVSATVLELYDNAGSKIAEEAVAIACSGSTTVWPHKVFGATRLEQAGARGYVLIRDPTCRLFGYHGLMDDAGGFSLDHMFGF
jgi:hypothetical protein